LTLNFCVMQQNWHELPDFFRFAETLEAQVWTVVVIHPRSNSVVDLPPDQLRAIVSKLDTETPQLAPKLSRHNRTVWLELIKELRNHAEEDPGTVKAVLEAARVSTPLYRAGTLMAEGKSEAALAALAEIPPGHSLYYLALSMAAQVRTMSGDYNGAEETVAQAIEDFPERPEPRVAQARLRYHQGRFEEGLLALDLAQENLSETSRADVPSDQAAIVTEQMFLVGASLMAGLGHTEQALAQIQEILTDKPDHAEALKLRDQLSAGVA